MNIIVKDNYTLMSAKAADVLIELIIDKPNSVIAWATGRTPIGLYQELTDEIKQGELSFKEIISFNLDDYVGVPSDHPASFHLYMKQHLFDLADIKPANIYLLDGNSDDLEWQCQDYEHLIKQAGGLDIAVLGIGRNGHIAFNEPGTSFDSRTHLVDLANSTREDLAKDFASGQAPRQGITIGLGTIMEAKHIILLASGRAKENIIKKALHGPITPTVPASILQKHAQVTVILDQAAAG